MIKEKFLDGNSRQYISVTDVDMLEQIAKLAPKYKSFNRLANDALQLGLPLLLEQHFHSEIKLDESAQVDNIQRVVEEKFIPDDSLKLIVNLLQEIVMNSNICKEIVSSLFNERANELGGYTKERFERGGFRYTPDFISKYEIDMLNAMDED